MQTNDFATHKIAASVCRNCCFYQPQGHNGGSCQQLNVSVGGSWPTCQLGLPAFAQSWQILEDLPVQEEVATAPVTVATVMTELPLHFEVVEASRQV
jgi:hypothetical protein